MFVVLPNSNISLPSSLLCLPLGLVVLLLGRRECERSSKKSVDHLSNLMVQVYLWVPGLWVVGSALRPSAKATSDSRRPRDVASHSEEVKHVQGRSTRWAPGCMKLSREVALCLPPAGRKTKFFTFSRNLVPTSQSIPVYYSFSV